MLNPVISIPWFLQLTTGWLCSLWSQYPHGSGTVASALCAINGPTVTAFHWLPSVSACAGQVSVPPCIPTVSLLKVAMQRCYSHCTGVHGSMAHLLAQRSSSSVLTQPCKPMGLTASMLKAFSNFQDIAIFSPCSSSPPAGGMRSTNKSTISATANSDCPTPMEVTRRNLQSDYAC